MCPVHPDRLAGRTCARCGNFMCDECSGGGAETQCPSCRAKTGADTFPISRSDITFQKVWELSFDMWKREWLMLSVAALLFIVASMASGIIGNVLQAIFKLLLPSGAAYYVGLAIAQLLSMVLSAFVSGVAQMGLFRICINVLHGQKADINQLFVELPKLPRYVGNLALMYVGIGVPLLVYYGAIVGVYVAINGSSGLSFADPEQLLSNNLGLLGVMGFASLLIAVPFIWVVLPMYFNALEIVHGNAGAIDTFRRVFELIRGYRMLTFGTALMFSLVIIAGFFACCVGFLPAFALAELMLTALYLGLRNGSSLPPPTASQNA